MLRAALKLSLRFKKMIRLPREAAICRVEFRCGGVTAKQLWDEGRLVWDGVDETTDE